MMTYSEMKKSSELLFDGIDTAVDTVTDEGSENLTALGIALTGDESVKGLMEKIAEIEPARLDRTLEFKVAGETYMYVSVKAGAAVAAVTEPSVQGFAGWRDSAGYAVAFPYTPSEDEVITALILENYGYVTVSAGDVLFIVKGITHTKSNTGFALCASYSVSSTNSSSTYYNVVCVSPDAPAAEFVKSSGSSVATARTLTYAGTTWYYCVGSISDVSDMPTADTSGLGRYYLGWHGTADYYTPEMAALAILNAYYGT